VIGTGGRGFRDAIFVKVWEKPAKQDRAAGNEERMNRSTGKTADRTRRCGKSDANICSRDWQRPDAGRGRGSGREG